MRGRCALTVAVLLLTSTLPLRVVRADDPFAPPAEAGSNVEPVAPPAEPMPPPVEPVVVPPVVVPPVVVPPPVPVEPGGGWIGPTTTAPEPTPAPQPAQRESRSRPMIGYRTYEGAFYDIDYGREIAPWASADGKTAIALGGLRLFESHGLMVNTVVMILALVGGLSRPLSPTRTDSMGNVYVNAAAEEKARAEFIHNMVEGAKGQPFSLEINGYHDSLGSEMNGMSFDLSISSTMYEQGAKHYGLTGGHLATNRNYVAAADTPMEFSRWWFGATYDYRRRIYHQGPVLVGFHGHAMAALADPWIALVTLGPEIGITDRFHINAFLSQDLHRFDLSKGMGYRAEIGMRF